MSHPNRRDFLKAGGAAALTGALGSGALAKEVPRGSRSSRALEGGSRAGKRLRTISYNILKCGGYPLNADNRERLEVARRWMDARLAVELFVYEADIVSLQECPDEPTVASIARLLRMNYCFFPSPNSFHGAILTRYDIIRAANCPLAGGRARPRDLFTRHFGRAVLETDGGELIVYGAHLYPGWDAAQRKREVPELIAAMRTDLESGASLLLQGDLNHRPDMPEYERWREAGLVDLATAVARAPEYTWSSIKPGFRVDYLLAHGPIASGVVDCRVLFEGPFRTNPADAKSFAISDHLPVMATFGEGG